MKVLIYKRTHKGDPDERGVFGIHDCMRRMRVFDYDAVIGIGGVSPWKDDKGIKYKVNWIGIGPKRISPHNESKINKVVFSKFELFEENGEDIEKKYPNLFDFM